MFLTPIKAALLWTLSAAIRDSFSFSYVPEDDGGALRRASLAVLKSYSTDVPFSLTFPKRMAVHFAVPRSK